MSNSAHAFVAGQRWISSTEPELGLGLITEVQGRVIQVVFPATEEERAYAANAAPLSRVQFRVGETIRDSEKRSLKVTDTMENRGVIIYMCEDDDGKDALVPEDRLDGVIRLNSPRDRLFAGQIDRLSRYRLRHIARLHDGVQRQSPVQGLLGPRVQLLPHQIFIAQQVGSRHAPRVLLADEVGLGKTIEAGMVVHQQLITGRVSRVLIVVPEPLLHQWLVEMLRRFNLRFSLLDEARCLAMECEPDVLDEDDEPAEATENPFETAQLVLCGEKFLCSNDKRAEQARLAGWDMLVVDEAHHLGWSPDHVSAEYACVESLANEAEGLLLLTATPEQMGRAGHFARLRLLDPDRYHDLAAFLAEENQYQQVSDVLIALRGDNAAERLASDKSLQKSLQEYLGEAHLKSVLLELQSAEDSSAVLSKLISDLLDRHGTGRVLFRNTRSSVEGFPGRTLHQVVLPFAGDIPPDLPILQAIHPETWLGADWLSQDPRVDWLVEFAANNRQQKSLLICRSADTAKNLERVLRELGIYAGLFHEGMSLLERDRAAAWFSEEEDGAQILLCSEIGSEGRNFQFASNLILFDLPLDADLLEQRIGRLDRIGQRGVVQIHVPVLENSAQQHLLNWYRNGLGAFEKPFQVGQAVMAEFAERLEQALVQTDPKIMDALIAEAKIFVAEVQAKQEAGRDRLLELNSCQPDIAAELVSQIQDYERPGVLGPFMEQVFDEFGVEHESHSAEAVIARPGNHMHGLHFPSLPEEGMTATFRREVAMTREDMQFLSWEHPMVTGAMEMVLQDDFGNTSLCTVKLGGVTPGTVLIEGIFVLSVQAPKHLQLGRYLPAEPVRLLRDNLGRDLAEQLPADQLHLVAERVPKQTAHALVKRAAPVLETLLDQLETEAQGQQAGLIEGALQLMLADREAGQQRLQALALVNPNVRRQEIEQYAADTEELRQRIASASLQLDAIRVAIAT
ncbi:MAG: RNA polymerase-associated protein RapA [Oceanococcus sp.]